MADLIWYVYIYSEVDGTPRYVGIGKTRWRWIIHLREETNPRLWNKIKKLRSQGIEMPHRKVAEGLSKNEACAEEIRLIALYGRAGIDSGGLLFNRTLGGDGTAGFSRPQNEKEKQQRREVGKAYWDSPEGQKRKLIQSEKAKAQMSTPEEKSRTAAMGSARKGKPGTPHTEEWKAMMSPIVAASNRRRAGEKRSRARTNDSSSRHSIHSGGSSTLPT